MLWVVLLVTQDLRLVQFLHYTLHFGRVYVSHGLLSWLLDVHFLLCLPLRLLILHLRKIGIVGQVVLCKFLYLLGT